MESLKMIVDVDDTISITNSSRDYANAQPIVQMIEKLNGLFDSGWEIVYFTARGQVSRDGNIEEIEKEVRPILEDWMNRNGVKRNGLIMGKPYGQYYLDDKALTPDNFMKMNFSDLDGRSGAELSRVGNQVLKSCNNVEMQTDWLKYANESTDIIVPQVSDVSPTNYRMEYLDGIGGAYADSDTVYRTILAYIGEMKDTEPMREYSGQFLTYLQRLTTHIPSDIAAKIEEFSAPLEDYLNSQQSMCHGDLTLDNVILANNEVYVIDPSIQKNVWSSWLIDVGRQMQSLNSNYEIMYKDAPLTCSTKKRNAIARMERQLGVPKGVMLFMQITIYARILHHQYNHSGDDGRSTEATLRALIDEYGRDYHVTQ